MKRGFSRHLIGIICLILALSIPSAYGAVSGSCKLENNGAITNFCGKKSETGDCFCDKECVDSGDCCPDYNETCSNVGLCTDSDGGQEYYIKGTVSVNSNEIMDYCSGSSIVEYYCIGDNYKRISFACPNGCNDSACTKRKITKDDALDYISKSTSTSPLANKDETYGYVKAECGNTSTCGNGICETGEADEPGGCGQNASPGCLGPPAYRGTCPKDCAVAGCDVNLCKKYVCCDNTSTNGCQLLGLPKQCEDCTNDICAKGTAVIKVKRINQSLNLISGTVAEVIGYGVEYSNEANDGKTVFTNLTPGTYTVRVTDLPDYDESYGTCKVAVLGTTGCAVSSYPSQPKCDGKWCTASPIEVSSNMMTKLVFQYQTNQCTKEAKICPDGSTVFRTGANCEFPACPQNGTAVIKIPRIDQNSNFISGTVAEVSGYGFEYSNDPSDGKTVFSNITPGTYTVRVTDLTLYNESYGTCTAAIGTGCSVSSYPSKPKCDGKWCTASPIEVSTNMMTKLKFQYRTQGTGMIKVKRINQSLNLISGTVAEVSGYGFDHSNDPSDGKTAFRNITPGTYTVRVTDLPNYYEYYVVCTVVIGTTGCNVSSYSSQPTCDGKWCTVYSVKVSSNMNTKIVFQYQSSSGGGGCPADAKVCPDGSSVFRTGANCEFPACPVETINPILSQSQTSTINVKRVSSNISASPPGTIVWVDGKLTPIVTDVITNPTKFSNITTGLHTVSATDLSGAYTIRAGTCSRSLTDSGGCTVASFPLTPTCASGKCSITVNVVSGQLTKVVFQYTGIDIPLPPPKPAPPPYSGPPTLGCDSGDGWDGTYVVEVGGRYFLPLDGLLLKAGASVEWKTGTGGIINVNSPGTDPITLTHFPVGSGSWEDQTKEQTGYYGGYQFSFETQPTMVLGDHQIRIKNTDGTASNWCTLRFKASSGKPIITGVSTLIVQTKSGATVDVYGNNFRSDMPFKYKSYFLSNNNPKCADLSCGAISGGSEGTLPFEFISNSHIRFTESNLPQSATGGLGPVGSYYIMFDPETNPASFILNVVVYSYTPPAIPIRLKDHFN